MDDFNDEEISNCITQFIDNGSEESHRYYLARKTLFELLNDRGYGVPKSEFTRSLSDFQAEFGPNPDPVSLRICAPLRADASTKVVQLPPYILSILFSFKKPNHPSSC
ncbi:DNA-directed RNA polymerase V subunit 5C [Bienertia sinuspersici]